MIDADMTEMDVVVREVCEHPETTWRPHGLGLVRVENILRALEGDSNE